MHPADPASATEAYVAPNINQPNAPLQGYMPNAAPPAFNAMPGYASNFPGPSNPVQPYPQQSLPMDTGTAPIQFLDPSTLSNYPVTTQEIIKRYSENAAAAKGTPEWEAAREQVMRSVGSSEQPIPAPILAKPRGRPRGRPRKNPILQPTDTHKDVAAASGLHAQPLIGSLPSSSTVPLSHTPLPQLLGDGMNTPTRGRGRGRPRGRGSIRGGRGGKRKRSDEDADVSDEVDTDDSEAHILESTTMTKSGRSVTKPTTYNPLPLESTPGSGSIPRKRRVYRGGLEAALCAKCDRGHSIASNVIVFCDGCNTAWHQWCHDPHIGREVVDVPEKEWFCFRCAHEREMDGCPIEQRVGNAVAGLSFEETNTYLSTLSSLTLRHLLLRATNLHPDLPIFDPNARQRIKNVPRPSPAPASLQPQTSTIGSMSGSISVEGSTMTKNAPQIPSQPAPTTQSHTTTATSLPTHPTTTTIAATSTPNSHTTHIPNSSSTITNPQTTSTHPPHPAPAPTSPSSTSSLSSDPYFDYDNPHHDPPYTYPRPGSGPIPLRPTTDPEDRMWLEGKEEDHAGVFSHLVRGANGELVPDSGIETVADVGVGANNNVSAQPAAAAGSSDAQRGQEVDGGDDAEGEPDVMEEIEFVGDTGTEDGGGAAGGAWL